MGKRAEQNEPKEQWNTRENIYTPVYAQGRIFNIPS